MQTVHELRLENGLFTSRERVSQCTQEQLAEYYGRVKSLKKLYQEEIVTRQLLKEAGKDHVSFRGIGSVPSLSELVPESQTLRKAKSDLQTQLTELADLHQSTKGVNALGEQIDRVVKTVSQRIDGLTSSTEEWHAQFQRLSKHNQAQIALARKTVSWYRALNRLDDSAQQRPSTRDCSVMKRSLSVPGVVQVKLKKGGSGRKAAPEILQQFPELQFYLDNVRHFATTKLAVQSIARSGTKDTVLNNFSQNKNLTDGIEQVSTEPSKVPKSQTQPLNSFASTDGQRVDQSKPKQSHKEPEKSYQSNRKSPISKILLSATPFCPFR